ncbi:MAG TPA: hypothetical protein VGU66_08120 [Candidatus Elarobacter sp.]|nr:hypothetical protein [Candidatus Elarobacter sp.]
MDKLLKLRDPAVARAVLDRWLAPGVAADAERVLAEVNTDRLALKATRDGSTRSSRGSRKLYRRSGYR